MKGWRFRLFFEWHSGGHRFDPGQVHQTFDQLPVRPRPQDSQRTKPRSGKSGLRFAPAEPKARLWPARSPRLRRTRRSCSGGGQFGHRAQFGRTGTRRFSSSSQFSTTVIWLGGVSSASTR